MDCSGSQLSDAEQQLNGHFLPVTRDKKFAISSSQMYLFENIRKNTTASNSVERSFFIVACCVITTRMRLFDFKFNGCTFFVTPPKEVSLQLHHYQNSHEIQSRFCLLLLFNVGTTEYGSETG